MVDILMATYNGEKYLKEQIDSILKQTYKEWILYIRDDGSKDNTKNIIDKYVKMYPNKIVNVKDNKKGLGAKLNFMELIQYSKGHYCMFSDQDDIWIENKIEISLNKIKDIENKESEKKPILVHTDLNVVDRELNIINDSFWEYQNLDPSKMKLNYLLIQNSVTGCTMIMNDVLVELAQNIPGSCIMHDWWIALLASSFGIIDYVSTPTILYRQHGNNEVGAHKYNSIKFIKNKAQNIDEINKSIENGISQAKYFYDLYSNKLSKEDVNTIKEFYSLRNKTFIKRKISVFKNKFYKNGFVRNLSYLIFI